MHHGTVLKAPSAKVTPLDVIPHQPQSHIQRQFHNTHDKSDHIVTQQPVCVLQMLDAAASDPPHSPWEEVCGYVVVKIVTAR